MEFRVSQQVREKLKYPLRWKIVLSLKWSTCPFVNCFSAYTNNKKKYTSTEINHCIKTQLIYKYNN